MNVEFFKEKKITVFGLGLHGGGIGTVKFLANHGAKVIVTDIKTKEQLAPSLEKLKGFKNIEYVLGQHRVEDFTNVDMVIKTPPAPWSNKHIKLALEKNIPVEIDSGLFFKLCKNPIIGVTGTKGKTTTATIIYEILKSAGKNPVKVGIGQISVLDRLDLLKKDSVVVFELSSWRLSALDRIKKSPNIAVFKNLLPDHLNYYKSMDKYLQDKKNIFLYQNPKDWLIINDDDETLKDIAKESKAQIVKFSNAPIIGGRSVFADNGLLYLNDGNDAKELVKIENLKIKGGHNISNIMAAVGATYAYGVPLVEIKKAILEFNGVPHRREFIKEVNGIKYYNDTSATIPQAAISGIESFDEPVILIAGGNDKELDFAELGMVIAQKVKGVVLLKGTATDKLAPQIRKNLPEDYGDLKIVDSMDKAVEIATHSAEKGDVVLLSPGAASFGLFLNEFDRGDKFKEAVGKLK